MKREILFRGKDIGGKHWFYGSYLKTDDNINECFGGKNINIRHQIVQYEAGDWNLGGWAYYDVIPETIGQFTGLTDKNGVKIFEGDKIRGISNNPFSMGQCKEYAVIWGVDHWHIKNTYFTLQELFNYCNNNIEIIGNIHDNKELIK